MLLAFNWVGYRLLTSFIETKADNVLEARIDNDDYEETSLIEIRVPLNAPYLAENSTTFERYNGELELDGVHYKYVKRKVENGELVLLCLPNESKTELQNSREEFFKLVNDLNHSQNKNDTKTTSFKSLTTEYKKENNTWLIPGLPATNNHYTIAGNYKIAAGFNLLPEHPPKA